MFGKLNRQLKNVRVFEVYGSGNGDRPIDRLYIDSSECRNPSDAIRHEIFDRHADATNWASHNLLESLKPINGGLAGQWKREYAAQVIRLSDTLPDPPAASDVQPSPNALP